MPRRPASDSGLPPGVLSQAVMPVKSGAGPQLTRAVALAAHLVSEAGREPVSVLSSLRIVFEPWNAYRNQYWPAEYLIDARGDIRHIHFGEGDYPGTERLIRQLLRAAKSSRALPGMTDVPDKTPTGQLSPETYVGYERLQYLVSSTSAVKDGPAAYRFPASLPLGGFALGGTWTDHAQEATAGRAARLELRFLAQQVYLVLGGTGTLDVVVNGRHVQTIRVAGTPRLYTLFTAPSPVTGKLLLTASPGVQAYDFTFG